MRWGVCAGDRSVSYAVPVPLILTGVMCTPSGRYPNFWQLLDACSRNPKTTPELLSSCPTLLNLSTTPSNRPSKICRLRSLHHGGYTIEGYSRAAVQSYWRVPELKVGFDLGGSPWAFMGLQNIFITHAHLDHMAALPVYVARRRMMKMEPPTIYLPAESVDDTWKMLKAWHRLDRGRMVCDLVGVKPGDEIQLGREHVVTVFETKHTVASVGFIVYDVRRKSERRISGLAGRERSATCGKAGEEVTHEVRFPDCLLYTGDTSSEGLDNHPRCLQRQDTDHGNDVLSPRTSQR